MFNSQFANVVEWQEFNENMLFWKWNNTEIKKGSRLILRPGQSAIFMYNGRLEGVFDTEGSCDIASDIIPFLSTLKGFKFGFNSGLRAEVLFINRKEVQMNWGTRQPVLVPSANNPGGLPVRANGSFTCKIGDYMTLIEKIAGVKNSYTVDDIKERILANLDGYLMQEIAKAGCDVMGLQTQTIALSKALQDDLEMDLIKIGIDLVQFNIRSFSYPKEIQDMINKSAGQSMVGDVNRYTQIAMADGMAKGNNSGEMASAMMGMAIAQQMVGAMQNANANNVPQNTGVKPKFCPNCGTPTNGANFCPNCGGRL